MFAFDYTTVSKLVHYDADSGKLFWLPRDRGFFTSSRQFKTWNVRYSGKEAFANVNPQQGYLQGHLLGGFFKAHRIAWLLFYREWPVRSIDHIDGNNQNNRISNLRDVSAKENNRNLSKRQRPTQSGLTGVYPNRRRWMAKISVDGKLIYIGLFKTKEEAFAARLKKQAELGFSDAHGVRLMRRTDVESFTGHNEAARLERAYLEAAE